MKKLFHFVLALTMILGLSAFTKKAPITVFMIGDSTMANKDTTGDKQERGNDASAVFQKWGSGG